MIAPVNQTLLHLHLYSNTPSRYTNNYSIYKIMSTQHLMDSEFSLKYIFFRMGKSRKNFGLFQHNCHTVVYITYLSFYCNMASTMSNVWQGKGKSKRCVSTSRREKMPSYCDLKNDAMKSVLTQGVCPKDTTKIMSHVY